MMREVTPLSDLEIQAYVDGQLDPSARAQVEGYLAANPGAAARVMGDLHLMTSLRAALQPSDTPNESSQSRATLASARKLSRARKRASQWRRLLPSLPIALVLTLVIAGYQGYGPLSAGKLTASALPADFIPAALAAHETSKLRLNLASQPEVPTIDTEELRAQTGILLPQFPPEWQLRDVQVFPSPHGPGIELVIDRADPRFGLLTAFAIRPGDFAVTHPVSMTHNKGAIAWFQLGETAHVLIADHGEEQALAEIANTLFARIN